MATNSVELDFDEENVSEEVDLVDIFDLDAEIPIVVVHEEDISDDEDETTLDSVPIIVFANEERLQTNEEEVSDSTPLFKCEFCHKEYFRLRGIKTHKLKCKGKTDPDLEY